MATGNYVPRSRTDHDVRDYGDVFSSGVDSSAAIQRAVNAAAADNGGNVYLPRGNYHLANPVFINGTNIRLYGDGPSTSFYTQGFYAGPLFVIGMPGQKNTYGSANRPVANGFYDNSVGATPRYGVTTTGSAILATTGHPLQLGLFDYNTGYFDYFGGSNSITFDFFIQRPSGVTWNRPSPLLGNSDTNAGSNPWTLSVSDLNAPEGFLLNFSVVGQSGNHCVNIPCDLTQTSWRITVQLDPVTPRAKCWLNGVMIQSAGLNASRPTTQEAVLANMQMMPNDGFAPCLIGGYGGMAKYNLNDSQINPITILGMRIFRGALYDWSSSTQSFTASPGVPVTDYNRYFETQSSNIDVNKVVAVLPLDDPPGKTWVKASYLSADGCMFWIPPIGYTDTQGIAIEDMTLSGRGQATILVGAHQGLRIERVTASGGSQGIGAMPLFVSYPAVLRDCSMSGLDTAVYSWDQFLSVERLQIPNAGRNAVRMQGGFGAWNDVRVWRVAGNTETIFQSRRNDNGSALEINRLMVDNEGGGVSRAFIEMEQSIAPGGSQLTVNGMALSNVPSTSCVVRLVSGFGQTPNPCRVDVKNLGCFNTPVNVLEVVGPTCWYGTFDASMLTGGGVSEETTGNAANITFIPKTVLH